MPPSIYLVSFVLWGSSIVWWKIFRRWSLGQPVLEKVERPVAGWRSIPELTVAFIALVCVCLALNASALGPQNREPLSLNLVVLQAAISFGLVFFLMLTLIIGGHPLSCYGMRFSEFGQQLKLGFAGFLAAVIPIGLSMAFTFPIRSRETEHSLLKLLNASPDGWTLGAVATAAVLSAPLWEELQFRVILQGWLSSLFPSAVAIAIVACSFSLVHGWRDGLALLPLAVILGYVFDRQHSYLAVVVIHALFNATMIALELLNN